MYKHSAKLGARLIASGLMVFSSSLLAQDDITSFEAIERHSKEMMDGAQRNADAFYRRQDARAQEDRMEQQDRKLDSIQREIKRQRNDTYWHEAREFRDSLDGR